MAGSVQNGKLTKILDHKSFIYTTKFFKAYSQMNSFRVTTFLNEHNKRSAATTEKKGEKKSQSFL